jgi:hypothetical protein
VAMSGADRGQVGYVATGDSDAEGDAEHPPGLRALLRQGPDNRRRGGTSGGRATHRAEGVLPRDIWPGGPRSPRERRGVAGRAGC